MWATESRGKWRKIGHQHADPESRTSPLDKPSGPESGSATVGDATEEREPPPISRSGSIALLRWQPGAVPPRLPVLVSSDQLGQARISSRPVRADGTIADRKVAQADPSRAKNEPPPFRSQADTLGPTDPRVPIEPRSVSYPASSSIDSGSVLITPPVSLSSRHSHLPEFWQPASSVGPGQSWQPERRDRSGAPRVHTEQPQSQYTLRELRGLALTLGTETRLHASPADPYHFVPDFWATLRSLEVSPQCYATGITFRHDGRRDSTSLVLVTSHPLPIVPIEGDTVTLPLDRDMAAIFRAGEHQVEMRISNLGHDKIESRTLNWAREWMAPIFRSNASHRSSTSLPAKSSWVIMPSGHWPRGNEETSRPSETPANFNRSRGEEGSAGPQPAADPALIQGGGSRKRRRGASSGTTTFPSGGNIAFAVSRAVYMLDSILLAHEVSRDLLQGIVKPHLMLRAITAPASSGSLEVNYENLEFHGDRILGFIGAFERYYRARARARSPQDLTSKPEKTAATEVQDLQTNLYLAHIGETSGIARYVRTEPFKEDYIGHSRSAGIESSRGGHRQTSSKVSRLPVKR